MRSDLYTDLVAGLRRDSPVALVTILDGSEIGRQLLLHNDRSSRTTISNPELVEAARAEAAIRLASLETARCQLHSSEGSSDALVRVFQPHPKLVIVGAVHVAASLVTFAAQLGFETWVIDPRTAFATRERFGHADHLVHEWPDIGLTRAGLNEASCVAVLSHDPKLDVPALEVAVASRARYVGALGSKKTHAKRLRSLRERGRLTDDQLARIHNPIGLDLGGRKAPEIAVAIIAEIVRVTNRPALREGTTSRSD